MFAVADEEEAQTLIQLACSRGMNGEYFAADLAREQTLENLAKFSDKCNQVHDLMVERGLCRCKE